MHRALGFTYLSLMSATAITTFFIRSIVAGTCRRSICLFR